MTERRRIDTHAHLIPADYRRVLERRDLVPYPLPDWSPDHSIELMDRFQIDATVVSLSPPGVYFGDQPLANELARMVNERTAALVRSAPARFAGLACLPLPDVDAAIAEATYAFDVLGLDGIALLSNVDGLYTGTAEWDPLFDELNRRGAYVFLHPTAAAGTLPLPEFPVWLHEFPFDTTRAVVNLVYSGTLERCPDIRLQLAHMGGTVPFLAHRLASLAERAPERAAAAPAGALDYFRRLYYDTGLSNHPSAIAAMRGACPPQHIVFGTDWPYAPLPDSGRDPAPLLEVLGADQRAALEGEHALALVPRLGN